MNTLYNSPIYTEESHSQSISGSIRAKEGHEISSAQVPVSVGRAASPTLQGGRRGHKSKGRKRMHSDDDSNFTGARSPASNSRGRSSSALRGNRFEALAQDEEEEEEGIEG